MKRFYIILLIAAFVYNVKAQSFSVGDNVQASSTTNVRDNAAGNILGTHSSGDKGVIKAGPTIANLSGTSYTWYQVQWASSPTLGWSINTNLSKVSAGTAPSLPTNTSPGTTSSPGTTQSSSNVNLSWSASSGTSPITYEVAVTDISSGSLVVDQYTTSTNYSANLQAGKSYRWNVQASNSIGKSAWTTVLYFQTPSAGTAPSLPTNTSPGTTSSPGPTQSSSNVNLSWSASSGTSPITYEVAVTDISSGSLVVDQYTTSTNYSANLQAGKSYRWNVQASNSIGKSAWTTVLYFQTPSTCSYSIYPTSLSLPSSASTGTISVTANTGCPWTAVSNNTSWLTVTSGNSGSGNGTVSYSYSANTSTSSRTGTITVGGQTFTVTQAGASTSNAPTITSVSPNPVPGSTLKQTITINGSNFTSGCTVTLKDITNSDGPYDKSTIFISSSQLQLSAYFTNTTAIWTAQVTSPQTSNIFQFQVNSSGAGGVSVPYFFSQRDTQWGAKILGSTGNYTIGKYGCAMTCVAMLLKWVNGTSYNVNPSILNDWLNNNSGYTSNDDINWDVAANQDGTNNLIWSGKTTGTDEWSLLDNELNNGNKPIVSVKYRGTGIVHYVIVYDRTGSSGVPSSYKILDPYDFSFDASKTLQFHSSSSGTIYGLRKYSGIPSIVNPTPIISNVNSNNQVTGKDGDQSILINGANFVQGMAVKVTWTKPTVDGKTLSTSQVTWNSGSQITMKINTTNLTDDWTVEVINPDGQTTGKFPFTVTASSLGNKIYGIDISHWNTNDNNSQINWEQVYNDGKLFAYIKATGGKNYIDPWFNKAITSPNPKKVILGAYHFAYPTYYTPEEEAQHFLDYASTFIGFGFLPPALDIEDDLGNSSVLSTLSADVLTNWVQRWLTAVENSPLNPNHIKPIVYTSSLTYAPVLKSSLSSYNLWVANTIGCDPNSNPSTGNWTDWKFHQYVDPTNLPCKTTVPNCAGFSTPVDLDVFNGDINALNALVGLGSGVFDLEHQNNLNIYPNPATTAINIKIPNIDDNLTVEIVSLQGAVLYSNKYNVQQDDVLNVNVSNLSKGIYIIRLNGNNNICTAKMIKE